MRFFFPDSQDLVDPSFDFDTERRSPDRLRHRDDHYAHECFSEPVHDGLLVSKAIVDGVGAGAGKYTLAQRQRLMRVGAREFFRVKEKRLPILGDCGAFTYVREERPPFSVDEVISFYDACGFDLGVSVDHVILSYNASWGTDDAPNDVKERRMITLELASEFLRKHRHRRPCFSPIGVAQGWSPASYSDSVRKLQKMGYDYIALGGMVPLKTNEILDCLAAIHEVKKPGTAFHLFGVTRTESVLQFEKFGVASFDSTSPLRQAFKDDKDNYYAPSENYLAIRIPQTDANPALSRKIRAGIVDHDKTRALERHCLRLMSQFSRRAITVPEVLRALEDYQQLFDPGKSFQEEYRRVLEDKPWERCACDICRAIGYHVILFRGAERNRRRGFHNLFVFYQRLKSHLGGEAINEERFSRSSCN